MSESANVLSTDVLVMGGGIAGLCAANKAVDQGVDVLITDKAVVPWGGQMPPPPHLFFEGGGGVPPPPLPPSLPNFKTIRF